ncbi:hypothetical protein [Paenibacillus sp. MSJ-34]|uniref:hypothetical protein n=1 Tax=Paenibacillus sp. MSJ-34 TaxID=2841529 RepID=UPI0020A13C48|nr:hypothetical protein [Paenibacillus sp. MSJ-34]
MAKVWGLEDVRIGDIIGEQSSLIKHFGFAVPQTETRIEAALKENYDVDVRFTETGTICMEKPEGTGQAVEFKWEAGTAVYEPIYRFELTVPEAMMSKAVFKLSAIRAAELAFLHTGRRFYMVEPAGFVRVNDGVPTRARTDYNPLRLLRPCSYLGCSGV